MPIIARAGATFTPAPAGAHAAVCVDVIDLGQVETTYSGKTRSRHVIKLVWQIAELRDDGKPYQLARQYTLSLHEKAGLRKDLESWRGRAFNAAELNGFDVEVLVGVPCLLSVIHAQTEKGTFANVNGIMKLPKGMAAPDDISGYVRVKDRPPVDAKPVPTPPADDGDFVPSDDDVPF